MMKHLIFSILVITVLVTQQALLADDKCFVQGSPSPADVNRLYVRGTDNHIREWRKNGEEGWKARDLPMYQDSKEIMSDPLYFKIIQSKETEEHLVARGREGHLWEWQRRYSSEDKWVQEDLTDETEGKPVIAGTPSRVSNGILERTVAVDQRQFFFATPTPENHLLSWSLKRCPKIYFPYFYDDDCRDNSFEVNELTTGQTSAGNAFVVSRSDNKDILLTRSREGHLLMGRQDENFFDITKAVGQQTIVGDPTGYYDPNGQLLIVSARGSNNHLLVWYSENETDWTELDLTMAAGDKTIAGDPIFYVWKDQNDPARTIYNVLARGNDDHLLKWSVGNTCSTSENTSGLEWSDLTKKYGGRLIKGEPVAIASEQQEISENTSCPTEKIFVTDQNNHLLEWQRQWVIEPVTQKPVDYWQVTDLTEYCLKGTQNEPVKCNEWMNFLGFGSCVND